MSRNQNIIIGAVALLFIVVVGGAFNVLSHQEGRASAEKTQIQNPLSQADTATPRVIEETVDGVHVATPAPALQQAAPEQAIVSSKADAEKMLQDTESDFQSIDTDVSAQ